MTMSIAVARRKEKAALSFLTAFPREDFEGVVVWEGQKLAGEKVSVPLLRNEGSFWYKVFCCCFFFLGGGGSDQDELAEPAHCTVLEMTSRNQVQSRPVL